MKLVAEKLIMKWLEIGLRNPWIRKAWDPEFNEDSFEECKTIESLIQKFEHGNWCLGTAFYFRNLCFINQAFDGGDEWLVVRDGKSFESWNCEYTLARYGPEKFKITVAHMLAATEEQLGNLEYRKSNIEGFEF